MCRIELEFSLNIVNHPKQRHHEYEGTDIICKDNNPMEVGKVKDDIETLAKMDRDSISG